MIIGEVENDVKAVKKVDAEYNEQMALAVSIVRYLFTTHVLRQTMQCEVVCRYVR